MRGVGHRNAEAESDPQIRLRNGKKTLGQRIGRREEQGDKRQSDHFQILQWQDQAESAQGKETKQRQRLFFRHLASGQRPVFRSRHMRIDMPVGEVIDHATGGAHQYGAEHEDPHHPPVRLPIRREPQGPQRRPKQQENANRLVEAHQALVEIQAFAEFLGVESHGAILTGRGR